ncbi:hypothetical protein BS78_10G073100 [Paspalum vaginatum]|nr:hypothetical protein BS78_10G073100 [Paspalum vaginatum]
MPAAETPSHSPAFRFLSVGSTGAHRIQKGNPRRLASQAHEKIYPAARPPVRPCRSINRCRPAPQASALRSLHLSADAIFVVSRQSEVFRVEVLPFLRACCLSLKVTMPELDRSCNAGCWGLIC